MYVTRVNVTVWDGGLICDGRPFCFTFFCTSLRGSLLSAEIVKMAASLSPRLTHDHQGFGQIFSHTSKITEINTISTRLDFQRIISSLSSPFHHTVSCGQWHHLHASLKHFFSIGPKQNLESSINLNTSVLLFMFFKHNASNGSFNSCPI